LAGWLRGVLSEAGECVCKIAIAPSQFVDLRKILEIIRNGEIVDIVPSPIQIWMARRI
jgi:hypothetical protein